MNDVIENEIEKKDHKKLFKFLKIFFIVSIIITGIVLYSRYIATTGIIVKEYRVDSPNIPNNFDGIKIAHVSDIHYGRTTNKKDLDYLVDKINETKPDIVVFTGDLIDSDTILNEEKVNEMIESLSKIEAKLGKYSIKGNHDYDFEEFDNIVKSSGFNNLSDTYDLIYNESNIPIMLVGLDSNLKSDKSIEEKISSINEEIKEINCDYKILLLHEPDYIDEIDYSSYGLVLAGHSHGGQIRLPFVGSIVNPTKAKKYYDEHYKLNSSDLFISSGVGTSSISFRLFNRPSFNLYRISK